MTDRRRIGAVAAQDAPGTAIAGEGGATPRPRIDYVTRLLVARLRDAEPERSVASIAAVAGISESSARRLLSAHATEVKTLAKQMMVTATADRLEDWERACEVAAEKGYHQPSKDWLEAAQVIEPKPTGPSVTVAPTVVLNMPFALGALAQPTPPEPPALEAEVVKP